MLLQKLYTVFWIDENQQEKHATFSAAQNKEANEKLNELQAQNITAWMTSTVIPFA